MGESVTVAGLRFTGDPHGPRHVHVTVRGYGQDGQRPLLGTLVMAPEEWVAVQRLADVVEAAGERHRWVTPPGEGEEPMCVCGAYLCPVRVALDALAT